MRTLKLLLLFVIMIAIVILALANRHFVTVNLLPDGLSPILSGVVPNSYQVPLFLLCLASIVVGMVLGYLLEWLREHKHRRLAKVKAREADTLNREVDRLKRKNADSDDEVLALLSN